MNLCCKSYSTGAYDRHWSTPATIPGTKKVIDRSEFREVNGGVSKMMPPLFCLRLIEFDGRGRGDGQFQPDSSFFSRSFDAALIQETVGLSTPSTKPPGSFDRMNQDDGFFGCFFLSLMMMRGKSMRWRSRKAESCNQRGESHKAM